MLKREKEVYQYLLDNEEAVIKALEKHYRDALHDINLSIRIMQSDELTQSKVYQLQYQEALKKQVEGILERMHAKEYTTIQQYLSDSYKDAFVGTMYSIHGQNVPLIIPIDQNAAVKAVITDSKIKEDLYKHLAVGVDGMKEAIRSELTRGIASNMRYVDIARNIEYTTHAPLANAKNIVRTEGHRIQQASSHDARLASKNKGADVVKQWDATLDGATRRIHRELDGKIVEVDEYFKVGGAKALYPGDFGEAGLDCQCRCVALTRARWALDESELETLKERAEFFKLDKTEDFQDFKEKYLKAAEKEAQKTSENTVKPLKNKGNSGTIVEDESASSGATVNPVYANAISAGAKTQHIGGVDCAIVEKDHRFSDGTSGAGKNPVKAKVYVTPDGAQFIYPKGYDKKKQTLTPDEAISAWYRVPENLRAKIQHTIEIVDYYNPQDALWRKRYKNFTHSYAIGGDKITFFRATYHDFDYLAETFCHEGGHYIDYNLPGTDRTNRYSLQSDWQNAMAKDYRTSGKKSWRAYGENSPLEDFADSIAYYTFKHKDFVSIFPERAKLLDNILK